MKTIGLLGGMTCESSLEYYRLINQLTRKKLGGVHSARSIMLSVDFAIMDHLMVQGDWPQICQILSTEAQHLERAGADFLVICTNTMHKMADAIQEKINIPILNLIDATAAQIKKQGIQTIGLLGTRFTMEMDFYKQRLKEKHHLEVLIPEAEEINTVHRVISTELAKGQIKPASNRLYWEIIKHLSARGAGGVILGCTEIPLLVQQSEGQVPLFDTTYIHAAAAVDYALNDE